MTAIGHVRRHMVCHSGRCYDHGINNDTTLFLQSPAARVSSTRGVRQIAVEFAAKLLRKPLLTFFRL